MVNDGTRITMMIGHCYNNSMDGVYRAPKLMSIMEDSDRKRDKDERAKDKKRERLRSSRIVIHPLLVTITAIAIT
jgi:hypothetical protein